MPERKELPHWLAHADITEPVLMEYCGEITTTTKAGKEIKPVLLMGATQSMRGNEWYIFFERIQNRSDLMSKLGKNDDLWKTKRFKVSKGKVTDKTELFILEPTGL